MLEVRMKRLLGSRVFWGTVIVYAGIMVAGAYGDLVVARANFMSVLYLYNVTTTVGIASVLIPAITIIPFAFFYVEELEKKSVYYHLIRSSKRSYYLSNIAAAFFSSVLVTVFALLLFVLVCLAFGAVFEPDEILQNHFEGSVFAAWLEEGHLIPVLLSRLLAFVAYVSPWGLLCLVISVFSKNKYVIIAFPFILELAVRYTLAVLPLPLPKLDPYLTISLGSWVLRMPYGGIFYSLGYNGVWIAVFSVFYYVMSRRRYHREGI